MLCLSEFVTDIPFEDFHCMDSACGRGNRKPVNSAEKIWMNHIAKARGLEENSAYAIPKINAGPALLQ